MTMKKLTLLVLFALFGSLVLLDSCNNDSSNPEIPAPTISVAPTNAAGLPGADVALAVVATAGTGASVASITVSDGTNTDNVNGDSYTYSVPSDATQNSQITLTFTVTDNETPAKTATATATVTVGTVPAQTITLKEPGDKSGLSSFDGYDSGSKTYTMMAKNTYILDGFVYVNDGQTLVIEPGTVVQGLPGQGEGASALIIARGGKIMAEGTATDPIIFTGKADDLNGSVPDDANSLWGGVIFLGKATTSNLAEGGEKSIEGLPTTDDRNLYGGNDDSDNSGVFKYVSVRHGGSVIGANNEINGLSMGAVGNGTVIDHVEVLSNFDDGIEFFGGAVNVTNWVSAWVGDDGLDLDEGFHGSIQNALVWTRAASMESDDPRGCELDGGNGDNEPEKPYATAILANITLFYQPDDAHQAADTWIMRDNYGGSFINSIFYGYDAPINIERRTDKVSATDGPGSSYDRWVAGDIKIKKNVFYDIMGVKTGTSFADIFVLSDETDAAKEADVESKLSMDNTIADPGLGIGTAMFTPSTDAATTDLYTGLADLNSSLTDENYKGAVDPAAGKPFFADWTKTWELLNQ